MARARLTRREADFLKRSRVIRVATASLDRQPHNTPVCAHWDGEVVYFATEGKTRKGGNLQDNPLVSVVADD